jgi:methylenetetrahydrofolate dehydrogenase (NADP+)/methenyltetrahydrofolate cyclohydrolase
MFREELTRRGARMGDVLALDDAHASAVLSDAGLVVVSVGKPGAVDATGLARGAVAIDVGYFNPGGRGDVRGDTSHLSAIAPVPGGIGPMTVSMLIERTILFAEHNAVGWEAGA